MMRKITEIPATISKQSQDINKQYRVAAYCRVSTDKEEQENSAILIIQRVGIKKYLYCKIFVIILVVFLIHVIPLLINLFFCHFTYPIKGFDSAWAEPDYLIGIFSYDAENFIDMMRLQNRIKQMSNVMLMIKKRKLIKIK